MRVCVCVCVCVHTITQKSNRSRNMIFKHVVYENILDKVDIEHCRTKVKVTAIQTVRSNNSFLAKAWKLILRIYVHLILIY